MSEQIYNVLFLCTGNSARSILAESILNHDFDDRFKGYSAGSFPMGRVHPVALGVLNSLGHDTSYFRSKSWDEFSGSNTPQLDFVFTVCDNASQETCPVWVGHPMTAHWGIPDPAAVEGSNAEQYAAFQSAYRMMRSRISLFASLPLSSLDPISLKNQLKEIGTREYPSEQEA
ncbi:MAG: arsenate reductase ArsC [Sphingomonadaceae bacterium]|nr:arsenate reductase ArsC [Sphingomonadaceae bacterium]